jgi:hypothetical protein
MPIRRNRSGFWNCFNKTTIPNTTVGLSIVVTSLSKLSQVNKWNFQLSIAADVSELMETIATHMEYRVFCSSQRRAGVAAIGHIMDPRCYADLLLSPAELQVYQPTPPPSPPHPPSTNHTHHHYHHYQHQGDGGNDNGNEDDDEDDDDWSLWMAEPTATTTLPTLTPTQRIVH